MLSLLGQPSTLLCGQCLLRTQFLSAPAPHPEALVQRPLHPGAFLDIPGQQGALLCRALHCPALSGFDAPFPGLEFSELELEAAWPMGGRAFRPSLLSPSDSLLARRLWSSHFLSLSISFLAGSPPGNE